MSPHRLYGVLFIVLLLIAGACSGDDASPTTAAPATTGPVDTTDAAGPTSTAPPIPSTTTTASPASQADALVIECQPGTGPDFHDLELNDADFDGESIRCGVFDGGTLNGASFVGADLTGASFAGTEISQARFDQATAIGANFTGAALGLVRFNGTDLRGAIFDGVDVSSVRWGDTVCPDGTSSEDAGGTCADNLTPIPTVVEATDPEQALAPLEFKPLCAPESGEDYTGEALLDPDFRRADLRCGRFDGAQLVGADFTDADVSAATFEGATLTEPVFRGTSLFGTSFAGATISRGQFSDANLIGADLSDAVIDDARWQNTICPNGVNSDQAGGTCLGSRSALDLPVVDFNEITDADITVRQGGGLTTYTIASDVLFEFDSDTLTPQADEKVRLVIASIAERFVAEDQIQIWGHADAVGDPAYNLDLSQRRADNVAALMAADATLGQFDVEAIGLGERQPIAPNTNQDGSDNPEGRALNRRVEIVVRSG